MKFIEDDEDYKFNNLIIIKIKLYVNMLYFIK